jgi:hypothetical protein
MTHQPHEEAEHASHHAHTPFDRRVAMSMVAIAALLAAVKVAGHRAHNEVLKYHTQASNQWSYFQAKKNRLYLNESQAQLLALLGSGSAARAAAADRDDDILGDLLDVRASDEEKPKKDDRGTKKKRGLSDEDQKKVKGLVARGLTKDQATQVVLWQNQVNLYEADAVKIEKEARDLERNAKEMHHKANFYDFGELFVELALVLSSVAILTRRPPFWYGGLAVGAVGVISAMLGFVLH